ncbi:MAG: hypothetical protein KIS67_04285 [Verrucomicrobiae bacterium]|nr:hypothetical protein [Verrucomicrobiae bacterium]
MTVKPLLLTMAQIAVAAWAITLGVWAQIPWPGLAGLVGLHASLLLLLHLSAARVRQSALLTVVGCTLFVPVSIALDRNFFVLDNYHVVLAWLNGAGCWLALRSDFKSRLDSCGRVSGLAWSLLGAFILVAVAYRDNAAAPFYGGLVVTLGLLVWSKRQFALSAVAVQAVNTLLLLIMGLPVADLLLRPTYRTDASSGLARKYYSYDAARQDPGAFAHWWKAYLDEWDAMGRDVFEPDPSGVLPFRLRPGSTGRLFDSRILINRQGFRGAEIAGQKGNGYRIVALGESTTFGCTLHETDQPWPEVLERLIRERLQLSRPVEVINAGVPAYNLRHNLQRLPGAILPLQPDLIISYHGINGFFLLDQALPRTSGPPPPRFRPRPLRLLADAEHRLKMMRYRTRQVAALILQPPDFANPQATEYAEAYRELIEVTRSHGIRLALANYSMAVNPQSDLRVAEFYRTAAPAIHWVVRANSVHSQLVKELAAEHPDVLWVDTRAGLDGRHEMFIDLGHFTQPGRQQLAENIFAGIKDILLEDLARD